MGAAVEKMPPSAATNQYPPLPITGDAHHRSVEVGPPAEPEGGITEGEDASIGGHQPVALSVGRRSHSHDGCVEMVAAHRAVEGGTP